MYSTAKLIPTYSLLGLFIACGGSSSSSKDGGDAKSLGTDVSTVADGRKGDTNLTTPDTLRPTDARDATSVSDARDSGGDGALDGNNRDTLADGPRDTALDGGKLDGIGDAVQATDGVDAAKPMDATQGSDGGLPPVDAPASDIPPPPNSCTDPYEISMTKNRVEIGVNTTNETHDYNLPCGTGADTGGKDIVLSFYSAFPRIYYADTFGASWNTMLYFSNTCPPTPPDTIPGQVACNNDACGTTQSQAVALLPGGRHFLVLSGAGGEAGPVTINFQWAEVGLGEITQLPAGTATLTGTTSGTGRTILCEASGPENIYWWATCPSYAGGAFAASTCTGTAFDVVLSMQLPKIDTILCANGDSCGSQEQMSTTIPPGAGIHALAVDGDTQLHKGAYTLTVTRP